MRFMCRLFFLFRGREHNSSRVLRGQRYTVLNQPAKREPRFKDGVRGAEFEAHPGVHRTREINHWEISYSSTRLRILSEKPSNSLPIRPGIANANSCRR